MGRAPCCDKASVKKGPWSPEEDAKLKEYIESHGTGGNWIAFPQKAGLKRCGKSCRLRWLNYLRPNIKHGEFSEDEDRIICTLFASIGSRWSIIAAQLPGRTDNDIKNYWNTKLKKKLLGMVQFQHSHRKPHQVLQSPSPSSPSTSTFLYNNCSSSNNIYHTPSTSFTSFETSYYKSPSFSAAASIVQPQESLLGPIHHNYQRFGGDQASCSSSDGSCSNQINHNRELDYEYGGSNGEQLGSLQSYSNFYHEANESQKQQLILGSNGSCVNGFWGETETSELEYELEEIKQLISTSSCNSFIF